MSGPRFSDGIEGGVFVVTGATQGIGEAAARALAAAGAGGLLITGRNHQRGETVRADLAELGAECAFLAVELAQPEQCRAVMAEADRRFGRVDGLLNAAGTTDRGTIENTSVELWDRIFAINVRAPFLLIQDAVRIMRREGTAGRIVNIITMSSHGGQPFLTAYSASKGALAALTKNVAHAVRADRIRVNGLNIGWSDTPGEHRIKILEGQPPNWLEIAEKEQPFGRLIKPDDVALLSLYLLGTASGVMTGSVVDYDQNVLGAYD